MNVSASSRAAVVSVAIAVACSAFAPTAGADVTYSGRAYGAKVILVNPQPRSSRTPATFHRRADRSRPRC